MFKTIIASCIGGLLAILIIVLLFRKKGKTSENPVNGMKEVQPEKPIENEEDIAQIAMDNLLNVNIFIRTRKVPDGILKLTEEIIDDLRAATPRMIERHPEHDLTYELKEICQKHLMKQLKEFFDMSESNQAGYMENLSHRLNEIADLIRRARDIVESDEVTEMKMIAGFLETKYSSPLDNQAK